MSTESQNEFASASENPLRHVAPARLEGRMLGRHRLLAHVANGGMASVHVARAEGTFGFERLVAVKLLHPHLAEEDEFVAMLSDEARMTARIRHPKVVATLDVDRDPKLGLYIVMEYVEGDHLGNVLRAARAACEPVGARIAVRIVLDLLEGLGAAHDLVDAHGRPTPIIHRDISPHNVLVGVDGMARLADFGVARAEARITQTSKGRFKGKIAYMAPEQLADGTADVRSDLFAVGIVLFEALTGVRLFRAETTAATLKKLLHEPIPRVDALDPKLAPLADVVAKALARDPSERFPSADEMANALIAAATMPWSGIGIAEPREVADAVRFSCGVMLAERNLKIRASAAELSAPAEIALGAGSEPIVPETTRPGIARRKAPKTVAIDDGTQPRPRRARLVLGVAAAAALVAALVSNAPSTREPAVTSVGSDVAVRARDREANVESGIEPVIAADLASVVPTIVLRVRIDAEGRVLDASVYQPQRDRAELERHAIATVRGYRFRPAIRNGTAVASEINLPLRFRAASGPAHVVRIKGSDTIGGALGPDLAAEFRTVRPDVHVTVEALGSSTGFVGLFDGSADLAASSRPIRDVEADEARRLGVVLEETVIGYDGIAIVVHPSNRVPRLSVADLAAVFSGRIRRFSAVGGADRAIALLGRPSYSGTHGFFEDRVLAPAGLVFAREIDVRERSEELVSAVASDPSSIAYVGASYVDSRVALVPISDGSGAAVEPTEATIRDGTYPIYRPLLVYSRGTPRLAAADFLRFVLSDEGRRIVRAHGFVPSEAELAAREEQTGSPAFDELVTRIPFREGSVVLPSNGEASIRSIAAFVRAHPGSTVLVSGHADAEGPETENVRIGWERAHAVVAALVRRGVDVSTITSTSRGSGAPIATNRDREGRDRNRRVDVIVRERPR